MASPTVAGISALLLQQFRASYPGLPDPRGATLKAILAQTAVDIHTVGPDYPVGYGSVRAVTAVELIAAGGFAESEVGQGGVLSFVAEVQPGSAEFKVTLAWDDPAGTPNVDPVLVNDLDLRVIDPRGDRALSVDPGSRESRASGCPHAARRRQQHRAGHHRCPAPRRPPDRGRRLRRRRGRRSTVQYRRRAEAQWLRFGPES